ncbi:hypothetical protein BDN71DRAFT_897991 [Pleurotus eryngii]|uniref:Uncharacterized protein n=1 Tax=Pleurotus eryngii TaxID=5323 RepID=A0A9P6DGK9_PLEER|nr:hypothetical protein BDN71DRAFT_897991 [Pleurotus eryngii]
MAAVDDLQDTMRNKTGRKLIYLCPAIPEISTVTRYTNTIKDHADSEPGGPTADSVYRRNVTILRGSPNVTTHAVLRMKLPLPCQDCLHPRQFSMMRI